jgi:hypothetical protein
MDVMIKNAIWLGFTLSLLGVISASAVRADEWDKKTILTFSQPVEIPGQVLPAGTYTFKLADSLTDRHIVQIFTADGSQIIATVMAIPDYRLTATDQTVIKFGEVPRGSPEAIRAWFYPGNTTGYEFVYPKSRATQLAKAANAVVPAVAVDIADVGALKSVPIVAITPQAKEIPVTAAIQTTPVDQVATAANSSTAVAGTTGLKQAGPSDRRSTRQLPKTASAVPLIGLLGLGSIALAFGLMVFGRNAAASAV